MGPVNANESFCIQLDTTYGRFMMNRNDVHQPFAIMKTGAPHIDSEIRLLLAIADCLPDGAVILDAGANIGLISVPLAQRVRHKGGVVVAFEPQRLIYYMLAGNAVAGGLTNLICHQIAVSDKGQEIVVPVLDPNYDADFGMVSLVNKPVDGERVRALPIDAMGFERVDLIKIDVEQMEMDVLKGAAATIEKFQPLIWIEVWPDHYAEIYKWMRAHDYVMHVADALNFCAVHKDQLEGLCLDLQTFDGQTNPFNKSAN